MREFHPRLKEVGRGMGPHADEQIQPQVPRLGKRMNHERIPSSS